MEENTVVSSKVVEQTGAEPVSERVAAMRGCADFARMLAALYFQPLTQEQIDSLASQDLGAFCGLNDAFDKGLNDVGRYLRRCNTGTRQQLACDFTSAFVGTKTYEGKSAVPYESVFTSPDGLLCQQSYHEVSAIYRREGLAKDDGHNIPDDHLSYMLEFTGVMLDRAASAIEASDAPAAQHAAQCAAEFIERHMLSWFDEFEARALLLLETRFYRGVLSMTRGFLDFALEALRELAEETEEKAA